MTKFDWFGDAVEWDRAWPHYAWAVNRTGEGINASACGGKGLSWNSKSVTHAAWRWLTEKGVNPVQNPKMNMQAAAYTALREMILYGELIPGARLVETELTESLGLGRTPIREALLQLRGEGLVNVVPQSGTFVSTIDLTAADDARFIRTNAERAVVREGTKVRDATLIDGLGTTVEQMRQAAQAADARAFLTHVDAFHEHFYAFTNRLRVWQWLMNLSAPMMRLRWLQLQVPTLSWQKILTQHQELLAAVEAGNAGGAEQLIIAHLKLATSETRAIQKQFPDYFYD